MSVRCLVIDDEKPAREKLKRLLAIVDDFEVVGEAADAEEAVRIIDELEPDLCFLDVQMPEGTGFDVLRRVRRVPAVIFTTAYDRYAVQAFEVRSLDYLLKPFSRKRLAEALDRAREALVGNSGSSGRLLELLEEIRHDLDGGAARETPQVSPAETTATPLDRISARRGAKILLLDPTEILWFEAEQTLVFARTAGGRYLVERTLADLETDLARDFFRTHRRYLVNLGQIGEIQPVDAGTYVIVLRDEAASRVPLSRRQARKLRERFPW